jgi:hypothetical protein
LCPEKLEVVEIQKIGVCQSAGSKSAQSNLGALDAPYGYSRWCKGATKSVSFKVLMERLSTLVAASLGSDFACKTFRALEAFRFQAEVDCICELVGCELPMGDWIRSCTSSRYHRAPERLVSEERND